MHVFHAAQPALLYLSSACALAPVLTAMARGELAELWAYKARRARPCAELSNTGR